MSINEVLNSLEKSWERDDILLKIKNGSGADEIVNEFLAKNEMQINELNNLLRPEDIDLFNQVEKLSNCESKLINKIKNLNYLKNDESYQIINQKNILQSNRSNRSNRSYRSNRFGHNKISSLMINWSNKFVVIALLLISAIALTKQAWA